MKDFFTKNLSIKLFSLFLALGLWVYISSGESRVDFFPGTISVEPRNLGEGLAAVYEQSEIRIKVLASHEVWSSITADSFVAFVDLGGKSLGTHEVPIQVTCSVPGVQIIEKDPEKILVRVENEVAAQVPVVVKTEGKPSEGYAVSEIRVEPDKAEARGAKSIIAKLGRATARVKLAGESKNIEKQIKLEALDENEKPSKFIFFDPQSVKVSVAINRQGGGRTVGIKVKTKGEPAAGFWLTKIITNPSVISIVGEDQKLSSIFYIDTKEVDISGISGDQKYATGFNLPEGIGLAPGEPAQIEVTISAAPVGTSREVTAGITYTGLGVGLNVTDLTPGSIRVVVSGPTQLLSPLSADNVVVNLNLSGKAAGSHSISIQKSFISVPPGVVIASFVPSNITVRIE